MNLVQVKGNRTGLTLILDNDAPFKDLCIAVCQKFAESAEFFNGAKTTLAFEGRELTLEEKSAIIECIEANCNLFIAYIQEKDEYKDRQTISSIAKITAEQAFNNAKIVAGPLFTGEEVQSDTSLLIIGDVKAGAKIQATGNIIVTGTLAGEAMAGYPNNRNTYIYAGDYDTAIFRIGDLSKEVVKNIEKKKLFGGSKKESEGFSFSVYDGELICEPFEKGLIKQLIVRV